MFTQLIENQAKEGTDCEKVLGSTPRVRQMSSVWVKYAQSIHLIGADGLLAYLNDKSFTDKELEAFRAGLSVIPNFMQKCFMELEASKKDTE